MIIGSCPPPVGGVSIHVKRLLDSLQKDIFHWFLSEGMDRIILHNGRAGWVSVTGIKRSAKEREELKIVESQPGPIGNS